MHPARRPAPLPSAHPDRVATSHGSARPRAGRLRRRAAALAAVVVATAATTTAAPDAGAAPAPRSGQPDLGGNVIVFDPSMSTADIQAKVDAVAKEQLGNEMGTQRYALLFKPGRYGTAADPLVFQVGYYTEVAGLGTAPGDVTITGSVDAYNQCSPDGGCIALDNFWRSLSNLTIDVAGGEGCHRGTQFWAVSQAAPMRRVQVNGNVSLMDYCSQPSYASGGFIADSVFSGGSVINGSQQQFYTRNSRLDGWSNGVWNQVFSGDEGAPAQSFPDPPYTTLATTPASREKPYLYVDSAGAYRVFIPAAQTGSRGTSWQDGPTPGRSLPLSAFFVAKPSDTISTINSALARGQNLLLTPGVYDVPQTIAVKRADTVVLGLGLATLTARRGAVPMAVADVRGVDIAGITFDAGPVSSPALLQVGSAHAKGGPHSADPANPTSLQDVFFRVGGPHLGKATTSLVVNSDHTILDDVWAWRADHGHGVGWTREHRRHRRRGQRGPRHRHRAVRRALPEARAALERRRRQDGVLPERDAVRRAGPAGLAARRGPGLRRLQGGRHGEVPRGLGPGQLHLHERRAHTPRLQRVRGAGDTGCQDARPVDGLAEQGRHHRPRHQRRRRPGHTRAPRPQHRGEQPLSRASDGARCAGSGPDKVPGRPRSCRQAPIPTTRKKIPAMDLARIPLPGRRFPLASPFGEAFTISGGLPQMPRPRRTAAAVTGAATVTLVAMMAQPMAVAAPVHRATDTHGKAGRSTTSKAAGDRVHREHFDSRREGKAGLALTKKAALTAAKPPAQVAELKKRLGNQGLVTIDPLTSSPRQIARADGFLTSPSKAKPRDIVLGYVQANHAVFGLDASALKGLSLRRDYVDVDGTHHLSFVQKVNGIPVFGNGLVAHVTKDGRLIAFTGSPLASLSGFPGATPGITAPTARGSAVKDAGGKASAVDFKRLHGATSETRFDNGDRASLVWFKTTGGTVLAWQTQVAPSTKELYTSIVDAKSGRVLYRSSLVDNDTAVVWENFPGAAIGGKARRVNLPNSWLPQNSVVLQGPNAHVYTDVNDDNAASNSEEIRPSSKGHFDYTFTPFSSQIPGMPCATRYPCSWEPNTPNSWRKNAAQNATQVFYYVNKFHDHLAAAPIGFTAAAGNFEGVDAVDTQPLDGANTAGGLPDGNHVDNANMSTPPDGQAPTMQMYLFHQPKTTSAQDPFIATNGGDESDVVYHEYTHGLSNRLVVDANGNSTLGNVQAGSMGEAWSDWYAMDQLVNTGQLVDTKASGELRVGDYVGGGKDLIRTQPLDCAVGSTSAKCPGLPGKPGGYTYGDFGMIAGGPEVHADGEIWGETLWDLRAKIGSRAAESLVTRAMELSPANPSYLDMRNAILQADVVQGGKRARLHLVGVREPRHGLLRLGPQRGRHDPVRGLLAAAGEGRAQGHDLRHGDRRQQLRAARCRRLARRACLLARLHRVPRGDDQRQGRLQDPQRLLRHLPRRLGHQGRLRHRGGDLDRARDEHDEELPSAQGLGSRPRWCQRRRVHRTGLHAVRLWARQRHRPVPGQRLGEHVRRPRQRPE